MKKFRKYQNYNDYLDHQKEKTLDPVRRQKWLNEEWDLKLNEFKNVFKPYISLLPKNAKALCIGARTGQEVVALQNFGIDAVGIDIVPLEPHVVFGDMHELPFKDSQFDFVFSNVFDHSLYPDKKMSEIERVLKNGGFALLHLQVNVDSDQYAEVEVESVREDLFPLLTNLSCVVNKKINYPAFACMNVEVLLKNGK